MNNRVFGIFINFGSAFLGVKLGLGFKLDLGFKLVLRCKLGLGLSWV